MGPRNISATIYIMCPTVLKPKGDSMDIKKMPRNSMVRALTRKPNTSIKLKMIPSTAGAPDIYAIKNPRIITRNTMANRGDQSKRGSPRIIICRMGRKTGSVEAYRPLWIGCSLNELAEGINNRRPNASI
jgi:hypothetical protein